jgi:hypothetical protein
MTLEEAAAIELEDAIAAAIKAYESKADRVCLGVSVTRFDDGRFEVEAALEYRALIPQFLLPPRGEA